MFNFLKINNPVIAFLEKVCNLMIANVLFVLCSLPIVTIGASMTALCKTMQDYVPGSSEDNGIVKRFFTTFAQNFKQATAAWLLVMLFLTGLGYNLFLVAANSQGASWIVCVLLLILLVMGIGIASYVFALLARYENKLKEHYRNSLILLIGNLPRSLLLVGINTLVFWMPYFSVELFLRSFIAWLMIGFSLVCYGDMIVLRPIFQQLEKQAQSQGQ